MAEKKTYCQLDKHPCMTNWSPLLGMVCIYEPRVKLEYDAETKQYLRRPDCPLEKQEEVKVQLEKAKAIAENTRRQLAPFCKENKCEIAGSIRRGKYDVHDVDIVCIPISQAFYTVLQRLGNVSGGPKIYKVELFGPDSKLIYCLGKPFTADIYIANETTWATMMLIRTGSKAHNIFLCRLAKQKGMKLHADGSGLERLGETPTMFNPDCDSGEPIKCETETEIFKALGLQYRQPSERE